MENQVRIIKSLELTGHKGAIYTLEKSGNPGRFFSGDGEGQVVEWNLNDPDKARVVARIASRVFSLAFIASSNQLLIGDMEGHLYWIDLNNKITLGNTAHHKNGIFDIRVIDGFVFTFGGDGKLTKWAAKSRRPVETLHLAADSLRGADRLMATDLLAIGASDNAIYLVDWKNMRLVDRIEDAHENSVFSVKYTPEGNHLLSGGRDAHFKVWDVKEHYKNTISHPGHWYTVNHIETIPEKELIATGSRDKTIKLWDLNSFELVKVIDLMKNNGHVHSVNRLMWLPDQQRLISASDDRKIMAWEIDRIL